MKTYEEAVLNQWVIANHRLDFAKDAEKEGVKNRSCSCKDCKEHFEALEQKPN